MCLLSVGRPKTHGSVNNKMQKSVYFLSQKCVFYVFLLKHLLFSVYRCTTQCRRTQNLEGLRSLIQQNFYWIKTLQQTPPMEKAAAIPGTHRPNGNLTWVVYNLAVWWELWQILCQYMQYMLTIYAYKFNAISDWYLFVTPMKTLRKQKTSREHTHTHPHSFSQDCQWLVGWQIGNRQLDWIYKQL